MLYNVHFSILYRCEMECCPCGLSQSYEQCCGRFIESGMNPLTPEELMRSRYTAYTRANIDYIEKTMRAPANKDFDAKTALMWASQVQWLKLEVMHTRMASAKKGYVEFRAHFAEENKQHLIHELSEFHRVEGKWFYVNGRGVKEKPEQASSIGRNDACPCGSQKKFKKCCGKAG